MPDNEFRPSRRRLQAYLLSADWERTQTRYRAAGLPCKCLLCGSRVFQLHHVSYRNLGSESVTDLRPLCKLHHTELHGFLNRHCMALRQTDEALCSMSNSCAQPDEFESRLSLFREFKKPSSTNRERSLVRAEHLTAFDDQRRIAPQGVIDALLAQTKRQAEAIYELRRLCDKRLANARRPRKKRAKQSPLA